MGKKIKDWWVDIFSIDRSRQEMLDYPTQTLETLLKRIIKANSNEGDVVLDTVCGCGITVVVAEKFKRKWIGIDIFY